MPDDGHTVDVGPVTVGPVTHSVWLVGLWDELFQCRGCGQQWPSSCDPDALEQEPCGTRSGER